ncbi:BTAD domain-containing putative transcriptional regulator [Nocardia sp. NPDC051570]|uniref:AfsR/SARP family transcriptional regulator n=1 Tax=Nocardia sp. NPDC051570 TaxID=3364324 RepID=UPI0037A8B437
MTVDVLVDRVWGEQAPVRAREAVLGCVSRLRRALGAAGVPLSRRAGGYVVEANPDAVGLHRFRQLTTEARRVDDNSRAADMLEQALRLWRGKPFTGLDSLWLAEVCRQWEAEHAAVQDERVDRMLRAGRHIQLSGVLPAWVVGRPLDERLVGQWMLALHRSGRRAEALHVAAQRLCLLSRAVV